MNDEYWFWLTFPGGVVIGLVIFGPFIAAYFLWQWYKADKEKREKASGTRSTWSGYESTGRADE